MNKQISVVNNKKRYFNIKVRGSSYTKYSLNEFYFKFFDRLNNYKMFYEFDENFKISLNKMPIKRRLFTVLKSPHIDKEARDQFECCVYNNLIFIELFVQDIYLESLIKFLKFDICGMKISISILFVYK